MELKIFIAVTFLLFAGCFSNPPLPSTGRDVIGEPVFEDVTVYEEANCTETLTSYVAHIERTERMEARERDGEELGAIRTQLAERLVEGDLDEAVEAERFVNETVSEATERMDSIPIIRTYPCTISRIIQREVIWDG